jgi:hypothetical protein
MPKLSTPDQFKSRKAQALLGLIGLVLAYLIGTRAVDTGSWIQYGTALLLFVLALKRIARAIDKRV